MAHIYDSQCLEWAIDTYETGSVKINTHVMCEILTGLCTEVRENKTYSERSTRSFYNIGSLGMLSMAREVIGKSETLPWTAYTVKSILD